MKNRNVLRNAALATALAAVTVTAWAARESLSESTWVPHLRPTETIIAPVTREETVMVDEKATYNEPLPAAEAMPSNERVMPMEAVSLPSPASASQPSIIVEQKRLTTDERIQAQLMDVIAHAPNMSGQIGVEARDRVVTLSGWTATSGQARRAARYAYGIEGVKNVQNEIRARVGGSV